MSTMSNQLAFSLASLILIIALSLVAVPVEADFFLLTTEYDSTSSISPNSFVVYADTLATITDPDTIEIERTLPDIDDYFKRSALFTLIAPTSSKRASATDGEAIAARDVVISEIMWGIDGGRTPFGERQHEQFIELYNTVADADTTSTNTNAKIAIGGWILHYEVGRGVFYRKKPGDKVKLVTNVHATETNRTPTDPLTIADADTAANAQREYIIVDQVGNIDVVGPWVVDIGQSGSTANADDAKDLISMYRNIDYDKVEGTDAKRLDGIPEGTRKGSWKASTKLYGKRLRGTPGAKHFVGFTASAVDSIAHKPILINEMGNNTNDAYDWIELKNVSDDEVNLKNWQIGEIAGGVDSEKTLVQFAGDQKIPSGGLLLVVNKDPHRDDDHPLAAGTRINDPKNRDTNPTKTRYYVAGDTFKLTNSGKTLLVVRNHHEKKNTHDNIVDLTGTKFIADDGKNTEIWPLRGIRIDIDKGIWGHTDVVKGADEAFKAGFVYKRINAGRGVGKETWERVGYTGVGYKRSADNVAQHGGTPGFANEDPKAKATDLADGATVSISEIMYQKVRNAPQWIELYNSSDTQAINLNGWKLKIENDGDDSKVGIRTPAVTITLGGTIIPPNQTVIIVSTTSAQTTDGIDEDHRIIDLWGTKSIKEDLEATTRRYQLLSTKAFKLTLWQKDAKTTDTPVDVAGNLGDDGTALWSLPLMAENADGRSSIIRRYNTGPVLSDGTSDGVKQDGTLSVWLGPGSELGGEGKAGWVLASESGLSHHTTYYGNRDDIGTPGYRVGGALPVSLSTFRPERLKDTGEIVIRWITESELNNAGFNILRSETRDGAFTKINMKLIAGQGTTSERTTYTWKDTSAKPTVVYYYQIQDVSLDGQVQTLHQSVRLKGNVTAAGKLTTTWGELKALQ